MKRKTIKLMSLVLCVLMLISLFAGCAGGSASSAAESGKSESSSKAESSKQEPSKEETSQEEQREVVTLEFFASSPGMYEGMWWTKMLEEDLGIKVQCLGMDKEMLDTYIAGGDLPDVVRIDEIERQQLAYNAGLLIDFDEKADLIPNVFKNYPAGSLQFQRDKFADGKLHGLPNGANTFPTTSGAIEYAMRLDFPYFQEYIEANGEPELNDLEDFIPVLKWIQEQHPANEDGQPAYGVSIFAEWDSPSQMGYAGWFGQMFGTNYPGGTCELDMDTLEYRSLLADDSNYKKAAKFLWACNQAGILDPDSLTQTWDDYQAKTTARRLYSVYCFTSNDYLKVIPHKNLHTVDYSGALYVGNSNGNWMTTVSATSKYIDRACEFLNYCIDEENHWKLRFGPQGEMWDVNSDGMPYITEIGEQIRKGEVEFADGGKFTDPSVTQWNYRFLNNTWVYSMYGVTWDIDTWPTADVSSKDEISKAWEDYVAKKYNITLPGGFYTPLQLLNATDSFATNRQGSTGKNAPDDILEIVERLGFVAEETWKAIYANSEAEFDSIWKAMQDRAAQVGAEKAIEWYGEDAKEGYDAFAKYIY